MSLKCPIWNYKCWSKVELPWFVWELSLFMCFKSELPTEQLQKSVNRISSNIYRQIKSGFLSLKFKKRWNCCWNQVVNVNHSSPINTICLHCMENRLHEYVEQKKRMWRNHHPKSIYIFVRTKLGRILYLIWLDLVLSRFSYFVNCVTPWRKKISNKRQSLDIYFLNKHSFDWFCSFYFNIDTFRTQNNRFLYCTNSLRELKKGL